MLLHRHKQIIKGWPKRTLTMDDWRLEGRLRFGNDTDKWKVVCPDCHSIFSMSDYSYYGINGPSIANICIAKDGKPCINYTIDERRERNPVTIKASFDTIFYIFEFFMGHGVLSPHGYIGAECDFQKMVGEEITDNYPILFAIKGGSDGENSMRMCNGSDEPTRFRGLPSWNEVLSRIREEEG